MSEYFLQFIWQYSLYQSSGLKDLEGNLITVIHPGYWNKNEGPDFTGAKIKIGTVEWFGNIEIHLRASDWIKHQHHTHKDYQNIILHIVWDNEGKAPMGDFPTLELKNFVPLSTIEKYQIFYQQAETILCKAHLPQVPDIVLKDFYQNLLVERWMEKTKDWKLLFKQLDYDWRSVLYVKLAENFGFKINASPMRQLALSLPLIYLEKVADQPQLLTALFFGQAGLLPETSEEAFVQQLMKDYDYLKHKLDLQAPHLIWKFFRLHPPNFPTVRIAQLATLMQGSFNIFNNFLNAQKLQDIQALFEIKLDDYWDYHFHFGKKSEHQFEKKIGQKSIENIVINTIAPFQFFYGKIMEEELRMEQSFALLSSISPEKNTIIKEWESCGIKPENAFESQALIQLYNNYCKSKKCLECRIGSYILRQE